MKTAKLIDVHDHNITPILYTLFFSDTIINLNGNDGYYELFVEDLLYNPDEEYNEESESCEELFKKQLDRGYRNCYFDVEVMKQLVENPVTFKYAMNHLKKWLISEGVTKDDTLIIKIWW